MPPVWNILMCGHYCPPGPVVLSEGYPPWDLAWPFPLRVYLAYSLIRFSWDHFLVRHFYIHPHLRVRFWRSWWKTGAQNKTGFIRRKNLSYIFVLAWVYRLRLIRVHFLTNTFMKATSFQHSHISMNDLIKLTSQEPLLCPFYRFQEVQ